jgi:hypothetical protein
MKIFLDNFVIYNDMGSHLMKLRLCFQKCSEYKINLNRKKCAFMVFLGLILSFQRKKNTKLQEGLSNSEYANTYKPIADSSL